MQVSLDLVGILRDYYPLKVDISAGPASVECQPGSSVRELLNIAGVPATDDYFIMLDGARVDLAEAAEHMLHDGDAVTLVAVIKGG